MMPIYGFAAVLLLISVKNAWKIRRKESKDSLMDRKIIRLALAISALILLIITSPLLIIFPVFKMPQPTGPNAIGTRYFRFIDQNRLERFSKNPNEYREIVAQVWYPAQPVENAEPVSYRPKQIAGKLSAAYAAFLSDFAKAPSFTEDYLALVKTHSFKDAPLINANEKLPVLIYSHGISVGLVTSHITLMESLASHGYIVISIGHPYESAYFVYPDQAVKTFSNQNPVYRKIRAEFSDALFDQYLTQFDPTADSEQQKSLIKKIFTRRPEYGRTVKEWATDFCFVIDEAEKLNQTDQMFAGQMDLDRIGVLGWSCGGASAAQACLADPRIKAGINMDGLQFGDLINRSLSKPFMFMENEKRALNNYFFKNHLKGAGYLVKISGTRHLNFTDAPLIKGVWTVMGALGSIPGNRCVEIINKLNLAFFDKHLKGIPNPILDNPTEQYPEIEFQMHLR